MNASLPLAPPFAALDAESLSAIAGFRLGLASEWRRAVRTPADVIEPLMFFVVIASLYPIGVTTDTAQLATIGPGVIWVSGLLAVLLSLPRLYASDLRNGVLEQVLLSPYPLVALVGARLFAHWVLTGLPLVLISPLLGLSFGLSTPELGVLALTILLGTPILSLVGGIGSALALGARANAVLVALLVLPLEVPVLIFAMGTLDSLRAGLDYSAGLMILTALLLAALVLAPLAAAAALRIALE